MKRIISILVSFLVAFLLSFQATQYFYAKNLQKTQSTQELNNKKNKKVSYGEGEYEKVSSKWNVTLVDLYNKVSSNMTNQLEKVVLLNYIVLGKAYQQLWDEMIKIDPPKQYKMKHENYILETEYALKLCDSYLNHLNLFDYNFKQFFVYHHKNTK